MSNSLVAKTKVLYFSNNKRNPNQLWFLPLILQGGPINSPHLKNLMKWLILIVYYAIYHTKITYNMPFMDEIVDILISHLTNGGLNFAGAHRFSWKSRHWLHHTIQTLLDYSKVLIARFVDFHGSKTAYFIHKHVQNGGNTCQLLLW